MKIFLLGGKSGICELFISVTNIHALHTFVVKNAGVQCVKDDLCIVQDDLFMLNLVFAASL